MWDDSEPQKELRLGDKVSVEMRGDREINLEPLVGKIDRFFGQYIIVFSDHTATPLTDENIEKLIKIGNG